jgi:drug/metabolite transporter (DMT)-like permease
MFLLFVLYAFFASTFIIGREAVLAVPPMFFIGIRMVLAGILLVGFVRIFNKESFKIKKEDLFWFAGIVLFHIYGSYVL